MSAAGRNLAGAERHVDDFYATPSWATRAILPHVGWIKPSNGCASILDPCCGDGAIFRAVYTEGAWLETHGMKAPPLRGFEIDETRTLDARHESIAVVERRDALAAGSWGRPELILTNPPYALAMAFVQRALLEVAPGGDVAMLLRLPWLASQERAPFHRANPSDVYVLPKRPSFVEHLKWKHERCVALVLGNGKGKAQRCQLEARHDGDCRTLGTDATDYMWAVWGPGRGNRWFILEVEGGAS